jgi:hypothetical protein
MGMGLLRKYKEWSLNNAFNDAVRHEHRTPDQVMKQLEAKGYEFRSYTDAAPVPMGGMAVWTVTYADKFNGRKLSENPELKKQYEEDRVKLVHAHFGKAYPSA